MPILAFTGEKGSGKDTCANFIKGKDVTRIKFADPLKDMLRTLLSYRECPADLVERMIEGDLKEVATPYFDGLTPRHAMVTLGTEWGRDQMDRNMWMNIVEERLIKTIERKQLAIITDARFENEIMLLRKYGATIVYIERPGKEAVEGAHRSESGIKELHKDVTIINDGTLPQLYQGVVGVLKAGGFIA